MTARVEWAAAEDVHPYVARRGETVGESEVALDCARVLDGAAIEGTPREILDVLDRAAALVDDFKKAAATDSQKILADLRESCGYSDGTDEVDYEVNESVDALIDYKDALEGLVGQLIEGKGVQ